MTIFEKIIAGRIPAKIEYQDEYCIAFHDIDPQAPTHLLIVPRKTIPRIGEACQEDQFLLGHLLLVAQKIAKKGHHLQNGFRLVVNHGLDGGESVPHLHIHFLAGRPLKWPPG